MGGEPSANTIHGHLNLDHNLEAMRRWILLMVCCHMTATRSFLNPSAPLPCRHNHGPVRDATSRKSHVISAPPPLTKLATDDVDAVEISTSRSMGIGKADDLGEVYLYDTTLRDGTQMEGISASVNDKLKIAKELHNFGAN